MGNKKKLPPGFVYDRPVPQAWQAQLAQLAPQSELHPWLLLTWLSGDPWEEHPGPNGMEYGVQRWCVYEMVPLRVWWGIIQAHRRTGKHDSEIMELYILQHLEGPHPRDLGHYDEVLGRFVSEAEVTRQEWELFRAHKAIPKLFWIVQGTAGGHKRVFTPLEQKYLQVAGLPTEPPLPGDLAYADFDERVMIQLARRDRMHRLAGQLAADPTERDEQFVAFRKSLVGWLEDQQREQLENYKLDLSGIPTSSDPKDDPTGKIEEEIDRFIQTGSTQPPPES